MADLCNGPAAVLTPPSDDESDHVVRPSTRRAAVEAASHPPPPAARPSRPVFPSTSERLAGQDRGEHPLNNRTTTEATSSTPAPAMDRTLTSVMEPLPSHAWSLQRLHWHGFAEPGAPLMVLWTPTAVATWLVAVTGLRELHGAVVTAAANGDPVRVGAVVVEPVTTDCCAFRCVA